MPQRTRVLVPHAENRFPIGCIRNLLLFGVPAKLERAEGVVWCESWDCWL
jgi:hypothetical protein